jgi:hypothetical protein
MCFTRAEARAELEVDFLQVLFSVVEFQFQPKAR